MSGLKRFSVDDAVLGSIGRCIPQSRTINRLSTYLSTYSGSDKLFMIIQYTLKLLVPFMSWRARMQHNHGKRQTAESRAAVSFNKVAGIISDSRMLWRLFGLIPIIQWTSSIERNPNPNKRIQNIERLQALSMLIYYPLEHLYYFGAHSVYPISPQRLTAFSVWSCRAWAAYVILHFLHLREDFKALIARSKALERTVKEEREKTGQAEFSESASLEYKAIVKRRSRLFYDVLGNLAYFPQTIHWSLEKGYFTNHYWIDVFGIVAGLAGFKNGWDSTA